VERIYSGRKQKVSAFDRRLISFFVIVNVDIAKRMLRVLSQ